MSFKVGLCRSTVLKRLIFLMSCRAAAAHTKKSRWISEKVSAQWVSVGAGMLAGLGFTNFNAAVENEMSNVHLLHHQATSSTIHRTCGTTPDEMKVSTTAKVLLCSRTHTHGETATLKMIIWIKRAQQFIVGLFHSGQLIVKQLAGNWIYEIHDLICEDNLCALQYGFI